MTDLLEKHTEMYKGERRWRADSELIGRYFNLHEATDEECSEMQTRVYSVLKQMGFKSTVYDNVLAIGESDEEDSALVGRVEILWDLESRFILRNKKHTETVYCLTEICSQIRDLWRGDK